MPDIDQRLRDRVRQIITESGLSNGEFAAQIGLDGPKLSKSLSGVRRFTSIELALIAEVGSVSVDWLLTGQLSTTPALAARASDHTTIATAKHRATIYSEVFNLLNDLGEVDELPSINSPRYSGSLVTQGTNLGDWARKRTWEFMNPSEEMPLEDICEKVFGVDVAIDDFGNGFDGLAWSQDGFRLMLVNNTNHWTRQRFTIAHELAHALCVDSQALQVDVDVMDTITRRNSSEIRANAFAAAFLMPAEEIRSAIGPEGVNEDNFSRLLGTFGVSASSFAWRLFNLRLISDEIRISLSQIGLRRASRIGDWEDEYFERQDEAVTARAPGRLRRLAQAAYQKGQIGVRPLAAVLGRSEDVLLETPVVGTEVEDWVDEPVFSP